MKTGTPAEGISKMYTISAIYISLKRDAARLTLPLCLSASLPVQAAGPWTYNCSGSMVEAKYNSPSYTVTNPATINARAITSKTKLVAYDDQNIGTIALNSNVAYFQSQLNYLGMDIYYNKSGQINLYHTNSAYTGTGALSSSVNGSGVTLNMNCGGYSNCAALGFQSSGDITFASYRRISFLSSTNYNAPATSAILNLPSGPKNEYASHTVTFTHFFSSIGVGAAEATNTTLPLGDQYYPPDSTPITTIVCTRAATPLTLTLGASSIDFGTIVLGSSPVTRPLTWTATGSGQAGTWTLTFEPQSTDTSGKYINLGGADISVLDSDNNLVPLNTQVNIIGTSGSYKLSLDPTKGTPGTKTTNLNVTLTAN